MNRKKPLFVIVFALVLLAVLLIPPSTANAASLDQPLNWVKAALNTHNLYLELPWHGGWEVNVQELTNGNLRGEALVSNDFWELLMLISGRRVAEADTFVDPSLDGWTPWPWKDYALFHKAGEDYAWPTELGPTPAQFASYRDANIADFVIYFRNVYYPNPDYPPVPTVPVRFVFIDFGEPGAQHDLFQWYIWLSAYGADPMWWAMHTPPTEGINTGDPVPVPNGNVQVHVGE